MIRANDTSLGSPPAVVDDTPPKKGLLTPRNLIIVVGVVAWIAVLLLFVLPRFTAKPAADGAASAKPEAKPAAAAAAADSHAAPVNDHGAPAGAAGSAPKAVTSPQLAINNRVFNLAGSTAGFKYVKLSVVVQFADEKGAFGKAKGEALKKLQEEFVAESAGTLGAFNDILTTTVTSKTAAELATPQGKETLRQELLTKFNRALANGASHEHVTYVMFSDFVMQ